MKKVPKKITIQGVEFEIGPDIDLEKEVVYLPDGTRLTEQRAAEWSDEIATRDRGRPSLSGPGRQSPQIAFRVPAELRHAAEQRARREGRSVSDIVRRALEEYLAS